MGYAAAPRVAFIVYGVQTFLLLYNNKISYEVNHSRHNLHSSVLRNTLSFLSPWSYSTSNY